MLRVIVTDIDGTILDNINRKFNCAMKTVGDRISKKQCEENYSIKHLFSIEEYMDFLKLFYSEQLLELDTPVKGALDTLKWFMDSGFGIFYLTGRTDCAEYPMKSGTMAWLRSRGFPYPDNDKVFLSLKKDMDIDDRDFKVNAIMDTKKAGFAVVGVGDHLNDAIAYNHIGAIPFIFKHKYTKDTEFPRGTRMITEWEAVKKWVEENLI